MKNENDSPICAVIAMIFNPEKKVLMVKSDKWQNKWIFPGGKLALGEKLEDAVRREMKEELGIKLDEVIYWHFSEVINPEYYYKNSHFVSFIFICKTSDTNIKLNGESQEFQWIAPPKAVLLDIHPDSKKALENFLRDERYE